MKTADSTYIFTDTLQKFSFLPPREAILSPDRTESLAYASPEPRLPIEPLHKTENLALWLGYSIIFLILFAFLRLRGKELFPLLWGVIRKRKKYENVLNEGITQNSVYYILALFLSFSILSIGAVYVIGRQESYEIVLPVFGILCAYHILTLIFLRLAAWTFEAKTASVEAVINLWAFNIVTGLFIAPLVIALFFVKPFAALVLLKIIIICFTLFYLVKILRWLEILLAYRVPIFYMILYLCALEVLPFLTLYKVLVN